MIYFMMHFLTGYCHVEISGPMKERFLNLVASRQILIWRLHREGDRYSFYISRRGSRELEELASKTGCSFQYLSKRGFPFLFYRYRKRKCLAIAFFLSVILLCVLSRFIWKIDTTGCYSHSQEELFDYLKKKGIHCGMRISSLSCPTLEEEIREDFEDISWVSCERKGTLLTVAVKETLDNSDSDEDSITPCNLIAAKDGVIESIVVRRGTAKVKKGTKVKQGDILISGIVPLINDAGEVTEEAKVSADGDVIAVTKHKYENEFSLLRTEKKYTGKKHRSFGLIAFNQYFGIPSSQISFSHYDTQTEEWSLHIGPQFYLPFSVMIYTDKEYTITEKTLTMNQAKKVVKKQLTYFLAQYEAKGVEILKNNVKIDCDDSMCTAKGTIIMRERFGKIQRIS